MITKTALKRLIFLLTPLCLVGVLYVVIPKINPSFTHKPGDILDYHQGVAIYYNGGVNHVEGRVLAPDGYNIGLKYQCVEFIKRYYYERFEHKMPDSYGNAKDFFNVKLRDGELNTQRNMLQYTNGSGIRPEPDDLVVFSPTLLNRYGHVAIVAEVSDTHIVIAQQNAGPFSSPKELITLELKEGQWHLPKGVMGWLRLNKSSTNGLPT